MSGAGHPHGDTDSAPRRVQVELAAHDELGRRLVDALRASADLALAAVAESDPQTRRHVESLGLPTHADADTVDIRIRTDGTETVVAGKDQERRIPGADVLAVRRLVAAVAPIARLVRYGAVLLEPAPAIDRLTPCLAGPLLADVFGPDGPTVFVQRVGVPYERSVVHIVDMELATPPGRDAALDALRSAQHVHVGAEHATTADLQEARRDTGSPRGDAPEVYVWAGSVDVRGTHLHLIADVCPFAAPVPDILDAARELAGGRS